MESARWASDGIYVVALQFVLFPWWWYVHGEVTRNDNMCCVAVQLELDGLIRVGIVGQNRDGGGLGICVCSGTRRGWRENGRWRDFRDTSSV